MRANVRETRRATIPDMASNNCLRPRETAFKYRIVTFQVLNGTVGWLERFNIQILDSLAEIRDGDPFVSNTHA